MSENQIDWWDRLRVNYPVLYDRLKYSRSSREPSTLDPTLIARAAPPWLRSREFNRERLPDHVRKIFDRLEIKKVSDLGALTHAELLKIPNLSRGGCNKLAQGLGQSVLDGEFRIRDSSIVMKDRSMLKFMAQLKQTLEASTDLEKQLISVRTAPDGPGLTFRTIGGLLNKSGAHIQAVESVFLKKLECRAKWYQTLIEKLECLKDLRSESVSIRALEAKDDWFVGTSQDPCVLRYFVQCASKGNADIQIDGTGQAYLVQTSSCR